MAQTISCMNSIPAEPRLFIGSIGALNDIEALQRTDITNILLLLEVDHCDWPEYSRFKRYHISVEDETNANLIVRFNEANTFLRTSLRNGDTILVASGKGNSRAAAFLAAFFMESGRQDGVTPAEAIEMVQKGRPCIDPNAGFLRQLDVYWDMLRAPTQFAYDRIYCEWRSQPAPQDTRDLDSLEFEDDTESEEDSEPSEEGGDSEPEDDAKCDKNVCHSEFSWQEDLYNEARMSAGVQA